MPQAAYPMEYMNPHAMQPIQMPYLRPPSGFRPSIPPPPYHPIQMPQSVYYQSMPPMAHPMATQMGPQFGRPMMAPMFRRPFRYGKPFFQR